MDGDARVQRVVRKLFVIATVDMCTPAVHWGAVYNAYSECVDNGSTE